MEVASLALTVVGGGKFGGMKVRNLGLNRFLGLRFP